MFYAQFSLSFQETQLQVFYAVLDQKFHAAHPLGKYLQEILAETQNQYYSIAHVENTVGVLLEYFTFCVDIGVKFDHVMGFDLY